MASAQGSWLAFSSSSGATFSALYSQLNLKAQNALKGFYTDRDCAANERLQALNLSHVSLKSFEKKLFEKALLTELQELREQGLELRFIFLCGFFGILTKEFIEKVRLPVVNTHPSLLPAFPGLDQKVHQKAFREALISGFTVHLVTPEVDGGPILFQHPVSTQNCETWEQSRDKVREAEQALLAPVLEALLDSDLTADDRHLTTRELQQKLRLEIKNATLRR